MGECFGKGVLPRGIDELGKVAIGARVIRHKGGFHENRGDAGLQNGKGLRGIFHAFSSDVAMYERLREYGDFVFGIGGVVTFKKSALAEVVKAMRLEDLVVETDAPYLTPAPHRGTRNESSYVRFVAQKIAELQGVDYVVVAEQTTANAKRIFRL